jgi:hypothetical protein
MQLIINQTDKSVICTKLGKGRQHDFRIFKNSRIKVIQRVQVLADKDIKGLIATIAIVVFPIKSREMGN